MSYATVCREVQNIFVRYSHFRIQSTDSTVKSVLHIEIYLEIKFYIFLERFSIFWRIRKLFLVKIINSMHFHPFKKIQKISKNVKFGLQTYFNMKNTFNGRIGVLNSKMGDATRSKKMFCISRLTVA
jgi:hypothetical protein